MPASDRQSGAGAGRALQAQRAAVLRRQLHADHHGRLARHARLHEHHRRHLHAPTIFVPIPELDATKGFVADIANFLGQQFWTFIYPEIVAQPGETVNGVTYPHGFNLDVDGKPILSLQKLHFVYDPLAVLFTPNDLTHKYPLQPKQQVLALTNGQIQEGICWRTDHLQDGRTPPHNICAQQNLPDGWYMDRPNIIYSSHNRPGADRRTRRRYQGAVGEQLPLRLRQRLQHRGIGALHVAVQRPDRRQLISTVSSVTNMLVAVLFDYDNNDLGNLDAYDPDAHQQGRGASSTAISARPGTASPARTISTSTTCCPSQVPLLDQMADLFGYEVAFYNTDLSLPRQYWSLTYDGLTAPGLPNYIANVPPAIADPTFSNRTRSLLLNLENPVRPQAIGRDGHFQLGRLGQSASAERRDRLDLPQQEGGPRRRLDRHAIRLGGTSFPLYGLPTKYDFFLFSRDHYYTLDNACVSS